MNKSKRGKNQRVYFFAGIFLCCLVAFIAILLIPYNKFDPGEFNVGNDTTYFVDPVLPDGSIDYRAAINKIYSEGVTPQNNLACELFRFTDPLMFDPSQEPSAIELEYVRLLGLAKVPERMELSDLFQDVKLKRVDSVEDEWVRKEIQLRSSEESQLVDYPWRSVDLPDWSDALKKQQSALDTIVEASKRTRYFEPLTSHIPGHPVAISSTYVPLSGITLQAARELKFRAMNSIGDGRIEDAIRDCKTIRRLACLQYQVATPAGKQSSIRLFLIAFKAENELLACQQLTEPQLVDYRDFVEAHRYVFDRSGFVGVFERAMTLDEIQLLQFYGSDAMADYVYGMPEPMIAVIEMLLASSDLSESMRTVNRMFDQFSQGFENDSLKQVLQKANALSEQMYQKEVAIMNPGGALSNIFRGPKTRGRILGEVMALRTLPNAFFYQSESIRTVISDDVLLAGIAVARYQKSNGQYPDDLGALVPKFLKAVPIDPLNETPLVYKTTDDGFLLYSIGTDQEDDEGRTQEELEGHYRQPFISGDGVFGDLRICVGTRPEPEFNSSLHKQQREMLHAREQHAEQLEKFRRSQEDRRKRQEDKSDNENAVETQPSVQPSQDDGRKN